MDAEGNNELLNCMTCGRHFNSSVLKKHEPICIKNSKKKRKIFDSGKQRAEGSDIPINKVLKPGEIPKPDPKSAAAEAKTRNWREKHNILVESLRAAREYAKAKSKGDPLPPPLPAVIDSSLVPCPYCQRRFNEESSKRHILYCKDKQVKMVPKVNNAAVKKTLYKAPVPKAKSEIATQKISPVATNGTRQRTSPQSSQPTNSCSTDKSSLGIPKPSVALKRPVGRTQPLMAAVGESRTNSANVKVVPNPPRGPSTVSSQTSHLPRGPSTLTSQTSSVPRVHSTVSSETCSVPRALPTVSSETCSVPGALPTVSLETCSVPRALPTVSSKPSALPRGPTTYKKSGIPGPKSSVNTSCHECGAMFALARVKFCSECGVQKLAL